MAILVLYKFNIFCFIYLFIYFKWVKERAVLSPLEKGWLSNKTTLHVLHDKSRALLIAIHLLMVAIGYCIAFYDLIHAP